MKQWVDIAHRLCFPAILAGADLGAGERTELVSIITVGVLTSILQLMSINGSL